MRGEVRITNLKALHRALRSAGDGTPSAVGKALRPVAAKVAARAAGHTSGRIAAGVKPFFRGTTVGVRSTHPGGKVHEFVKPGQQFLRRSASGNVHFVRWRDTSPKGYLYRARDELRDDTARAALTAVRDLARRSGFLS